MHPLTLPAGVRREDSPEGARLLRIARDGIEAGLSLKGGQLLDYRQAGSEPLLYLSPLAQLAGARAIRGGVPVCWPWFGPHPTDPSAPQHGIARTADWTLTACEPTDAGLLVQLTGPTWQTLEVDARYLLGPTLEMTLTTRNRGSRPIGFSAALHSYLAVGDARRATVTGLAGSRYDDKVGNGSSVHDGAPLCCAGEIDRIVYDIERLQLIDPVYKRRIEVENEGSRSVVLWNPGPARAAALADLPDTGWQDFFCIETANAGDDARVLQPGECHTLRTRMRRLPV